MGPSSDKVNPGGIRLWHVILSVTVVGLVALFYKGLWGNPSFIPPVTVNTVAPGFTAPSLHEARQISLTEHQGKVVVLNFWASWCLECKVEHASLLAMVKRYEDNDKFIMIGVNYQDELTAARAYLEEHGNNFHHVQDVDGRIAIDYGVYGVPETFVIDQKGIIRHKEMGPMVGGRYAYVIEKVIEPLLMEKPVVS